jgi:hypothetical protein
VRTKTIFIYLIKHVSISALCKGISKKVNEKRLMVVPFHVNTIALKATEKNVDFYSTAT